MQFPAWRTYGAAVLAGVAAALAMPPLLWLPLGVAGIVVFVRQWDSAPTPKAAFLRGWAWGFGHFAVEHRLDKPRHVLGSKRAHRDREMQALVLDDVCVRAEGRERVAGVVLAIGEVR